jgi:CheY-like chemotaxis protein
LLPRRDVIEVADLGFSAFVGPCARIVVVSATPSIALNSLALPAAMPKQRPPRTGGPSRPSIATKTSYIKDGKRQARTEWHRIQVWGKLGEYAADFKKGAQVRVEGELRSREYCAASNRRSAPTTLVANSNHQSPRRPAQRRSGSGRGGLIQEAAPGTASLHLSGVPCLFQPGSCESGSEHGHLHNETYPNARKSKCGRQPAIKTNGPIRPVSLILGVRTTSFNWGRRCCMDTAQYRILIGDDDLPSLRLLRRQLERSGFSRVETASTGEEIHNLLQHERFDIVILDCIMPRRDGMSILRESRAQRKFDKTAFVIISAQAQSQYIQEARDAVATAYLVKPATQEELQEKMKIVLSFLEEAQKSFSATEAP